MNIFKKYVVPVAVCCIGFSIGIVLVQNLTVVQALFVMNATTLLIVLGVYIVLYVRIQALEALCDKPSNDISKNADEQREQD